jgi:hypothetical protein
MKIRFSKTLSLLLIFGHGLLNAQTEEGQIISGVLLLNWGKSAPLPDGRWLVKKISEKPLNNAIQKSFLLQNINKDESITHIAIQDAQNFSYWSQDFYKLPSKPQLLETYGTTNSTLTTKQSYIQTYADLVNSDYGIFYVFHLLDFNLKLHRSELKHDFLISSNRLINQRNGINYTYVLDIHKEGQTTQLLLENDGAAIKNFNGKLIESLYISYNERKPQRGLPFSLSSKPKDTALKLKEAHQGRPDTWALEQVPRAQDAANKEEQERVLTESKAKERERQLAESKDAELAALRAQLEKMKQQTAQATAAVQMAKRKALVIGNDSYKFISKLANAREDAKAMAENLAKVGYTVTLKTDLTEKEMKAAIRTFKSQVEAGDEVAIFYAGHGIQLENTNYLIPIDVAGDAAEQVKDEAIPLQRVLDDMADRKAKLTLALIDACRDNPFKLAGRSIGQGRGLAPTTAATGQMVVFSAGTGQQALDNLGPSDKEKNGIFTRIFIREMTKPDRTVDAVVRQVRNEVVRMAKSIGHEQVPAIYDQVVGEFYFARSGQ